MLTAAIGTWKLVTGRADKLFAGASEERLYTELAPGKNRLIYLWGHLTAVHDRMLPLLGLGPRLHPELDAIFLTAPDKTVAELPSTADLTSAWAGVNAALLAGFDSLTPAQWLERHADVSPEDFAREPHRNRLAILLNRTNHTSFHLGQAVLAPK
ncbi:DinB superfamily protein [Granulicella rosea]|uniref:DinB superfamily protein n=2 Tax=Granulicella rosea TaxID=474952 RepID=A0A239JRT6_9BACT|nr:DinB superfamily protein [Granulicella rosea]